jgi:hypothetical protein
MIVVINGMPRSGSTLAFNVTRALASAANRLNEAIPSAMTQSDIHHFLWDQRADAFDPSIAVVKCHYFVPPLDPMMNRHVRMVYTYRNPMDALYSSTQVPEKTKVMRHMGYEPFIGGLEFDYSHCLSMLWMNSEYQLMLRYEDFVDQVAEGMVYPIAAFLDLPRTTELCKKIADEFAVERVRRLTSEQAGADMVTQFRRDHVSANLGRPGMGAKKLPKAIVERLRVQFHMWMKECFWK